MNQLKYFLITRSKLLIAFTLGCIVAIWMIACAQRKEGNDKPDVSITFDPKEKPKVKIVHDTIYKCPPVASKPIPAITKYKVGDLACAWGKLSGVVNNIGWSKNDSNVLMYQLTYMTENTDGTHGWSNEEWFYESELNPGKCN